MYFVEWPASAFDATNSPLVIAILGDNPFGDFLQKSLDKKVEGREVKLVHFDSMAKLDNCHILYINLAHRKDVEAVLQKLAGRPILTVADMEGFTEQGGVINLTKYRNKPKLYINNAAARRGGLKINSRLLNVAEVTEP